MQLLKLPGTGAEISQVGQGATRMGTRDRHDREAVDARVAALRHGIARGLTYVDTAPLYGGGFSEEVVGEALAGMRHRCFLATKVYLDDDCDRRSVRQSIRGSMRRLGTDYLDLVQVHWPNPFAREEEAFAGLEQAVADGEVRHIGVSNYCAREISEAQRHLLNNRIVTNQYEFNLLNRDILADQKTLVEEVLLIAYSPLNQGRLTASSRQTAVMREIALEHDATLAQIALAAVLADGACVAVVRASSVKHVDDAAGALELDLTVEELSRIRAASPTGPTFISADEIDLVGTAEMAPYRSIEEARANKDLLVPSPLALAERLRNDALPMPLRVHRKSDGRYVADAYDPMDQVKKFWAWVIARPAMPIPVYVLES